MALSSAGIGSGLDVQSIVSQLVAAERSPAQTRLTRQETATKSTLSALGSFKSALADLQTAVNALMGGTSSLAKLTVTSSTPTLFSATTSSGAAASSFDVEVIALAKASKIATSAYASSSAVVGNGTVTVGVGSESFTVTLDGTSGNTLADLRDAINDAADNKGVTASLLNEAGGTRLILTSRETGVAQTLSLSSAAEVGGASYVTTSVVQTPQDAQIEIDGFAYTSGSNTISDAIDGVTIKLLKAEPGTVGTLGMTPDSTAGSEAVQGLVKAYNAVMDVMAKFATFNAETKTGGPLMGDASVRSILGQVRAVISGSTTSGGSYSLLTQLGVSTQSDGKLKLDVTKLDAALAADPTAIKNMFAGTDGFATQLDGVLDSVLGSTGRLVAENKALQARLDALDDQQERLDRRMEMVQARYLKQFNALDAAMARMQSTSAYLQQQLANLPGSSS